MLFSFFSNQPTSQSYQLTGTVVTAVTKEPVTQADWDFRGEIITIVRKMAHVIVYFCLGLFLAGFFETSVKVNKKKVFYKVALYYIVIVLVAGFDEFHQMFVSGRGASKTDVLIDIIGATVGLGAIVVLRTALVKRGVILNEDCM